MISLPFIMGFIGAAVGILVGILIFSNVETAIACPTSGSGLAACNNAKTYAWTVISILPIGLFFALFALFGGFAGQQQY